jgi:hypothetical protein
VTHGKENPGEYNYGQTAQQTEDQCYISQVAFRQKKSKDADSDGDQSGHHIDGDQPIRRTGSPDCADNAANYQKPQDK